MKRCLGLPANPRMTGEQYAAFRDHRAGLRQRMLQTAVVCVLGFYLACFAFDIWLLGDVIMLSAILRFGVILPISIGLLSYINGDFPIEKKENAAITVALCANICWCIILVSSSNQAVLNYYYAAMTFQMAITIAAASPFKPSLFASVFTFCLNYSAIWFLEGVSPAYVIQHLAVYMPTVAMTLLISYQLELEAKANYLQMLENETLKRELARQNKDLARLSITDPLTRLSNRRGTEMELMRLRSEAPAQTDHAVLLLVDVDNFKAFNDAYGHGHGDDCLKRVARAMRRALPIEAHLARHGGEEFVAIITDCDSESAASMAEALRRAVRQLGIAHEFTNDRNRHVTVSIGAACGSIRSDSEFERLLEHADQALYAAKADGRNAFRVQSGTVPEHPDRIDEPVHDDRVVA